MFCGYYYTRAKSKRLGHWVEVVQDVTDTPGRLESITVQSGVVVDAIAFSYADQAGQKRTAGPWGGSGRCSTTVTDNSNSEHFSFEMQYFAAN